MKPSECSNRFPYLFQWKLRKPLVKQYGVLSGCGKVGGRRDEKGGAIFKESKK